MQDPVFPCLSWTCGLLSLVKMGSELLVSASEWCTPTAEKTWDQSANIHSYCGVLLFVLQWDAEVERDTAEKAAVLWSEHSEKLFIIYFPNTGSECKCNGRREDLSHWVLSELYRSARCGCLFWQLSLRSVYRFLFYCWAFLVPVPSVEPCHW